MSKSLLRRLEVLEAALAGSAVQIVLWRGGEADSFVVIRPGQPNQVETRMYGETSAGFLRRIGAG